MAMMTENKNRMGRFISEDPIGLAGGDVNYFAYVRNQPCNLTDPLGLFNWKTFALGQLSKYALGPIGDLPGLLFSHGAALDLTPEDAVCGAVEGVKHGWESGYYGCLLKCYAEKVIAIYPLELGGKKILSHYGYKIAASTLAHGGLILINIKINMCTLECSEKL